MPIPLRYFAIVLALLVFAAPASAEADRSIDELERNRKLLEKWRSDPEHLRRLLADYKDFRSLPKARQEQLRQLDRALNQADPATQQRLWGVVERYYVWMENLPEADRKRVESATGKSERLEVIREIHEQQWLERMPKRDRDAVLQLPRERRSSAIAKLRREERQRRVAWQKAFNKTRPTVQHASAKPAKLVEFPAEVQTFVAEQLAPMLAASEKQALDKAEGHWPALALVILDLADRHPVLPPPHSRAGPTYFKELPQNVRSVLPFRRLNTLGQWQTLKQSEGRWPDFALTYTELARKDGKTLPHQLGACRPREFSPPVQQFIKNELDPVLNEADKSRLKDVEGKWPEYPRLLNELARAHNLTIPAISLPGPQDVWQAARSSLPDVPDGLLHRFAFTELTSEERGKLNLSLTDPSSRDRIKQAYFKKHPNELKRRLAVDRVDK